MITISIDGFEFPQNVGNAILTWFEYKRERGQKYRGIGRRMLLQRLQRDMKSYSESYVIKEINHSIENNYMGIYPPSNKSSGIQHGDDVSELNRKISTLDPKDL